MMQKIFLILSYLLIVNAVYCQKVVHGDIETYLNVLINDLPGNSGDDYQQPTLVELNTWSNVLNKMFNGNIASANNIASFLNFQIIEFHDITLHSNNIFYIIEEKQPQHKYWGIYVYSSTPLRNKLVIQAPHPLYDSETGSQGAFCFKRLIPKALFISGTHRCNHSQFSECSGTTTACDETLSPYRISDNAHNTISIFQRTTEETFMNFDSSVFVQLHGFAKSESEPYVIMSNGTRITPEPDYTLLIKDGLQAADPSLTFKVAHIDLDWNSLIAFNNTQGRSINYSSEPCTQNAVQCSGNFVHIEQEKTKLRKDSIGWHKMYSALKYAFSVDATGVSSAISPSKSEIQVYPNPNNGYFTIYLKEKSTISILNDHGVSVYDITTNESTININLKNQASGMYFIRLISEKNIYTTKFFIAK